MSEKNSFALWLTIIIVVLQAYVIYLLLGYKHITVADKPATETSAKKEVGVSRPVKDLIKKENLDFALVVRKDGTQALIGPDGKEATDCGAGPEAAEGKYEQRPDECRLVGETITPKALLTTSITKLEYSKNPTCVAYSYPGGYYVRCW